MKSIFKSTAILALCATTLTPLAHATNFRKQKKADQAHANQLVKQAQEHARQQREAAKNALPILNH